MRYWHRFLAPIFAALLLIVALTGVITRVVQSIDHASAHAEHGGGHHEHGDKGDKGGLAVSDACAKHGEAQTRDAQSDNRPAHTALSAFGHVVKDIHSGEALGPLGTVLSIASGLALAFFSVSGFWMYLQMWRRRRRSQG